MKPSRLWDFLFVYSNYHLEHHYFPRVPFYNLRKVHMRLRPLYDRLGLKPHTYREIVWQWFVLNRAPHTDWEHAASRPAASPPPAIARPYGGRPGRGPHRPASRRGHVGKARRARRHIQASWSAPPRWRLRSKAAEEHNESEAQQRNDRHDATAIGRQTTTGTTQCEQRMIVRRR